MPSRRCDTCPIALLRGRAACTAGRVCVQNGLVIMSIRERLALGFLSALVAIIGPAVLVNSMITLKHHFDASPLAVFYVLMILPLAVALIFAFIGLYFALFRATHSRPSA